MIYFVFQFVLGKVPHDDSPIERMCEVTGGRSYRIKSHLVLNQCIESLVQKVQPGVVVQFEQLLARNLKDGEVQDLAFQTIKKMIYVPKHPSQKNQFPLGFWPIPEPYWPDPKALSLPPRDAHPKIRITTPCEDEPMLVRNFPVDKYEVEACPLTLQILTKREPNKCWPVSIANGNYSVEKPFGYLKTCPPFTQVFLYILPYNYKELLPLVNDLLQNHNMQQSNDWINKFTNYFRQIPPYYGPFLRRALNSAGVHYTFLQYILPESLDNYLSSSVANSLKTMKNTAKADQDNMCLRVSKQLKMPKPPFHQLETAKLSCGLPLKRDLVTHPQLRDTFNKVHSEINIFENYMVVVPTVSQQGPAKNYRNPFDVPRHDLIEEIARMRENFYKLPTSNINVCSKDFGHCLPISEMGNYQEYLKNKEIPLREIEPTNVRQHMFGNPYKKDKNMVMVDEADLGEVMMKPNANPLAKKVMEPINNRLRKRKAGPIRKDYIFRRLSTDSMSDSSSISGRLSPMDTDDNESISSGTSTKSEDDSDNELVIDFGFNEPSNIEEELNENGHIQSFINGDMNEDVDDTPSILGNNIPSVPLSPVSIQTNQFQHTVSSNSSPMHQLQSVPLPVPTMVAPSINNYHTQHLPSPQAPQLGIAQGYSSPAPFSVQQNGSTQNPMTSQQTLPFQQNNNHNITLITTSHNDLNDAQEISKILQQCHNGATSSTASAVNTNMTSNINTNGNAIPFEPFVNQNQKTQIRYADRNDDAQIKNETENVYAPLHSSNHVSTNNSNDHKSSDRNASHLNNINSTNVNNNLEEDNEENEEHKENIKQNNLQARKVIFQDIRRPGRDYSLLLEHLNLIKGNLQTKLEFIQMCIEESQRFRRKKMADCIQEWWDKYVDRTNNFSSMEFDT